MKRLIYLIFTLIFFDYGFAIGQTHNLSCDSCNITVDNLDKPLSLSGLWLFTKNDDPSNKNIDTDISNWVVIKTPGSWKKAYADGKNFRIGWYRGVFNFAPELIGQKVTLLVDAYMSRASAYVDGEKIFEREGAASGEKYFSIQAIPLHFTITKEKHVFAFRVETILMNGIYQLPF